MKRNHPRKCFVQPRKLSKKIIRSSNTFKAEIDLQEPNGVNIGRTVPILHSANACINIIDDHPLIAYEKRKKFFTTIITSVNEISILIN